MQDETLYDILGLRPDASQRELRSAFGRLAERYRRRISDPAAREQFERVKAAYQTLTNYESRLGYNIEHGFPDPSRGRGQKAAAFLAAWVTSYRSSGRYCYQFSS